MHGIDFKKKIENLILEKQLIQMEIERNNKIQNAFFSPDSFVFYAMCIGLICAILQSLNII